MAMVKIKSGKTVKVGSRSKGGGYEYEVQADGSIKNLTTGRTTSPATVQKAMAPAKAARTSKAMVGATAEKKPPVPKTRPIKMTSAAARPEGAASGMPKARLASKVVTRPEGPASGMPRARLASKVVTRPEGPASGMPRARLPSKVVTRPEGPAGGMPRGTRRPAGFSKKRYSGGIFGLDIIKNN